jgi:tRNA(Arg) A34 adenosine deaminase TadA
MAMDANTARTQPAPAQVIAQLRRANKVAEESMLQGRHPFGAVLVGPDHETVLLTQGNVDSVNHAESVLAREAASRMSPSEPWHCTLYTTVDRARCARARNTGLTSGGSCTA